MGPQPSSYPDNLRLSFLAVPFDALQLAHLPGLVLLLIVLVICIERVQCCQRALVLFKLLLCFLLYNLQQRPN